MHDGQGWRKAKDALREIRHLGESIGARVAVVIEPRMGQLAHGRYPFRGPHRVIAEFCSGEGIPCFDLYETVAGIEFRTLLVHPVDHHSNEIAVAKYADTLAERLLDDGILPATPGPR